MALDRKAIDDVTFSISGAIDAVEAAMDRIEDCGLDDYERGKTKGMSTQRYAVVRNSL